jgi:hypothetical protein
MLPRCNGLHATVALLLLVTTRPSSVQALQPGPQALTLVSDVDDPDQQRGTVTPQPDRRGNRSGSVVGAVEAERWREDLRYMSEEMPRRHQNLFHSMTRSQFEAATRRLHERIPSLARHQIIVELARIVAMVGDGHTNIAPTRDPKIGFRTLPIRLYIFSDGLFVRATSREHAEIVGARLVRIGNLPADRAISRVGEIVGSDNEMDVKFFAPHLLVMPEVLHALGITEGIERTPLVVEKRGRQVTVPLEPSGPAEMMPSDTDVSWLSKPGWVDMRDEAKSPPPPWLRDPQEKFWFEYLKESKILYVQVNRVDDKESETLSDFSGRLFAFVDANPVEKLVLDLRLNRGGNGALLRPLVVGIIKSKIDRPGKLFTVIGRSTWSAAQFLVDDLEKYTTTLFVGEPSGSKINAYGDSHRILLPNSGITVRVSKYHWQHGHPMDMRPWTAPHLTAELTSVDYRTNADPAMKVILNDSPKEPLPELLWEALAKDDLDLAVRRYRAFMADPINKYCYTGEPLWIVGSRLLRANKPGQAIVIFGLNTEANPWSPWAYVALGEAYLKNGDRELAIQSFEKSLKLYPQNPDLDERLKQLRQP